MSARSGSRRSVGGGCGRERGRVRGTVDRRAISHYYISGGDEEMIFLLNEIGSEREKERKIVSKRK